MEIHQIVIAIGRMRFEDFFLGVFDGDFVEEKWALSKVPVISRFPIEKA